MSDLVIIYIPDDLACAFKCDLITKQKVPFAHIHLIKTNFESRAVDTGIFDCIVNC